MRYQHGTILTALTRKRRGLKHTVIGHTPTQYRLRAETGNCKGRVHYLPVPFVERNFAPCKGR